MSAVLTQDRDPGPLGRFEDVVGKPDTLSLVVQRITDHGDTLQDIARAWRIPYGKLCEWIVQDRQRSEQYALALRFAADTFVHQAVPLADAAVPEDVAVRKLQIETRLKVAAKWDRSRYGESTEVKHTGSVSLVAILSSMPRVERDVTPEPALEAPEQTKKEEEGII